MKWDRTGGALFLAVATIVFLVVSTSAAPGVSSAWVLASTTHSPRAPLRRMSNASSLRTSTPIKHLVVIYQENVSFDHYFATYPVAANLAGEPHFKALPRTPSVNGLTPPLLTQNPNGINPFRLSRRQALTCDMIHEYTAEQLASDHGLMDGYVRWTEGKQKNAAQYCPSGIVMGYYDGNTATALWNDAQHFAMDDNAFGTTFGPSAVGALHLAAADTAPVLCGPSYAVMGVSPCSSQSAPPPSAGGVPPGVVFADPDPYYDDCSAGSKAQTAALGGRNIGDMLNAAGVSWGWFSGGFNNCRAKHVDAAYDRVAGIDPVSDPRVSLDYVPHWEPFQYYASTANPHHLKPSSPSRIGLSDQANHQYDLSDFWTAAQAGRLPAVSFLKAPSYQSGHAGFSDPLDEQTFLVDTINRLERLPSWSSTAIIINYDDSDGWYDHVMGPIVNRSHSKRDTSCGSVSDGAPGRCGYGPRLPYLVISPYARANMVDHQVIDQTSTLRFIEDNWLGGQRISSESFDRIAGSINAMFDFRHVPQSTKRRLILDPVTGEPKR